MPELPEVETVRKVLEDRYRGKIISSVTVAKPTFYRPPPESAIELLQGGRIEAIGRKGKYLLFKMSGRGDVVFHLGMSGRITIGQPGPHVRLSLLINGEEINFHDSRRFGRVGGELPELGLEPIDTEFNETYFKSILKNKTAPIKAIIMDQRLIAGLGNIYATEALHLAKIRPARAGKTIKNVEIGALTKACRKVLELGIKYRGSTLADESFLDPMGMAGDMQAHVKVYGRKNCGDCGSRTSDTRKNIGGRSSRYCPSCQI